MRLLLIEDDPMTGESVQEGLRSENYAVDWVRDGRNAELALLGFEYDLLLLDLGLKLHERLERSAHLVRQLSSLARHETGYAATNIHAVDLRLLLQTAVINHSAYADSRSIDLGTEVSETITVQGNKESLHVMLNNLVDNALRYTQQGGKVDLTATYENGHAVMLVTDNGPGVEEQYRARLFDRFYRPDGNEVWGCGLGLSIVRNIADHHSAEIDLAGNPAGSGLVVTVRFP
ncbi:hybrid sensor histidine kinase/response regulator [Undibacterium sp. Tian12W]|uniref:hybrid sensor histidine kinase/response regulator n=1 Tax=Undibacterium sp. Tian12W TaxID=3413054 RepID=UPI003BF077B4